MPAALANFERDLALERTNAALWHKRARGEEKRQVRREYHESKGINPDGLVRWLGLFHEGYQGPPGWLQPILMGLAIGLIAVLMR